MTDSEAIQSSKCDADTSGRVPGEFWAATLAHELREPLNAIVLALHEVGPACAEAASARDACDVAWHQSQRMARIIEDVMDLVRSRRTNWATAAEKVDLLKVLDGALDSARPLLNERHHLVSVSAPRERVVLTIPTWRIEQILTNLLVNAARYTQPGGRIYLIGELVAGVLVLRVRDNGTGITPELLPHVFEPYRQEDFHSASRGVGLGIGLALVKSLTEWHGGTVTVASAGAGLGAEFIVRLPCVRL